MGIGHFKKPGFKTSDKSIISKYFNDNPLPSNSLPPGIQKNLARGKALPPGIKKVFLPESLAKQLPLYPGYEYLVVGDDVLLVDKTNDIIADIITNVIKSP